MPAKKHTVAVRVPDGNIAQRDISPMIPKIILYLMILAVAAKIR